MLKNKTQRFRRMSSAAIIGLAIYGSSLSPAWASDLRYSRKFEAQRVERSVRGDRTNRAKELTVGDGLVQSVDAGTMVVTRKKDGKSFSVIVNEKTKVFQGFRVRADFDQIRPGHKVFVKGNILNGDSSTLTAKVIRDMSLRSRLVS